MKAVLIVSLAALAVASCHDAAPSDGYTTVKAGGTTLIMDRNGNFIAEKPQCSFIYTGDIKKTLSPVFQEKLKSDIEFYDIDHPTVVLYRDHIELEFLATLKAQNGHSLTDADELIIILDGCNYRLKSVYFQSAVP